MGLMNLKKKKGKSEEKTQLGLLSCQVVPTHNWLWRF